MCNNYANHIPVGEIFEIFSESRFPLVFPSGPPNLEPNDDIRPTDAAPVILPDGETTTLVRLKWGLLPSQPKRPPVINMRSEGRRFEKGRCLIPASSFFEFTGEKYPKTRWRFSRTDGAWRPVEVRLRADLKGVKLRTRKGYFAPFVESSARE